MRNTGLEEMVLDKTKYDQVSKTFQYDQVSKTKYQRPFSMGLMDVLDRTKCLVRGNSAS